MNVMRIAIRDDDTSFFTSPDELEKAYDFIKEGCVSLSVVPSTISVHRDDVFPYGENIPKGFYDIENNTDLISYLKTSMESEKYDILLHGYSHEYSKVNGKWTAEMKWKDLDRIDSELTDGKHRLEKLFNRQITVFVAPNNSLDQRAITVIEKLGMDYSGIILHRDRQVNFRYICNYIRRWFVRFQKKIPYPGILDYGKHKELIAYTLDNFERLVFEYEQCKEKNQPFVIYTHYWQLNKDPNTKELLKKIYDYAVADGAEIVPLSKCFGE
jgi:peptidoglycan/xylan/chitin deacetylase (PgdA/CDA1 family)